MKKKLLAACVAALTFAGCHNEPNQKVTPPAPIAVEAPKVPVTVEPVAPPPEMARATNAMEIDAGSIDVATTDDSVALAHEPTPGVDHLSRARRMKEEGDIDGAIAECRRAIFDDAEDEDALTLLDRLAEAKNDLGLATRALHHLAALEAEDPEPLIREARLQIVRHEYTRAIQAANEAIARDEDNADAYHVAGRAHLAGGDLQGAIDLFKKAIEIEPEHGYALNNLGLAYLRASRNDEAVEVLAKAAVILPNVSYVQNNYGVALERVGKKDQAEHEYELASALSPKYLKARLNAERLKNVASAKDTVMPELDLKSDTPEP